MEPRIQYAKTSDAVNIAYNVIGDGQTLVSLPTSAMTHIQFEWQIPEKVRVWAVTEAASQQTDKPANQGGL